MGKDLKGKELGKGINQLKDGDYIARFTDNDGVRHGKRFASWSQCKEWMANMRFKYEHDNMLFSNDMTLDAWFQHWIDQKTRQIKASTLRSYKNIYNNHIKAILGRMELYNIKPIHCQEVLNRMMDKGKKKGTIGNAKRVLYGLFEMAYQNDLIAANPCRKGVTGNIGEAGQPKEALTIKEQNVFLEGAKKSAYYDVYDFILQTGIRIGELTGLKWQDVDYNNRTIHIQRTTNWNPDDKQWDTTTPKTVAGDRLIPLTDEAITVLKRQKLKHSLMKIVPFEWSENVFLGANGNPCHESAYNKGLTALCKKLGIKHISVHILRHTFATRCIEGGMKPKTLQKILGHSNIKTTMDLYVHTTEEEKHKEIQRVESFLKIV